MGKKGACFLNLLIFMQQTYRLVIDCPDQVGLVASVSQFLASHKRVLGNQTRGGNFPVNEVTGDKQFLP